MQTEDRSSQTQIGIGLILFHLQLLEEEVVESHKNLLDSMEHWIQQDASLLAMTNEVDYDQDGKNLPLESVWLTCLF